MNENQLLITTGLITACVVITIALLIFFAATLSPYFPITVVIFIAEFALFWHIALALIFNN